ncbi:coiled-coil domain-containing protein 24 [Dromaius novaehollandiae]|uniref:Coiled-coil domain containing 24 n=1 Tax=Dromaius novaehollandiae TaxID=8790 RepID=A0A8C4P3F5_DRONO|nr:coiled-coil domain-containing protein 24 isoform X1 [Dromaius novaehollandiae]XP_025952569.1 coiled-coil domain-containing protein 24 isoform X1 [Dromaius novaehollandiae]
MLPCQGTLGQPSLWGLLEVRVPPGERLAVRHMLGEEAVERSLELHAEVAVLQELWQERRATSPGAGSQALLAAPPQLRELVRGEIRLLLLSLQQRAAQEGRDGGRAVARYSPHVVSFAMEGTAGRRHDILPQDITAPSSASELAQRLDSFRDKLNITHLPQVLPQLWSMLEEECRDLEKHITHLQRCLEEEHWAAMGPPAPEPTLAELQDQRRAMEQDLQLGPWPLRPSLSPEVKSPEQPPRSLLCPGSPSGAAAGPGTLSPLGPGAPAPQSPAEGSGSRTWGRSANRATRQDPAALSSQSPAWPPACLRSLLQPGAVGHGPPFLPSPPSVLPPPRSALGRHWRLLPCKGPS